MIGLFRRMRKKLADDNQFVKYSRYAIGEILLVVVGILIALQVNNWNENRLLRVKEKAILKELRTEMLSNQDDIESTLSTIKSSKRSNELVLSLFEKPVPYHDSIATHFIRLYSYTFFIAYQTAYDNLKEVGIDIIQNKDLKDGISHLYSYEFTRIKAVEDLYLQEHYENYVKPIFINEFSTFEWPHTAQIIDYDSFLQKTRIKQILNNTLAYYGTIINGNRAASENISQLVKMIDQELEK
jgi:hypothetical protein